MIVEGVKDVVDYVSDWNGNKAPSPSLHIEQEQVQVRIRIYGT